MSVVFGREPRGSGGAKAQTALGFAILLGLGFGLSLGLGGCASPGPPQPPSLHLPVRVTDLQASRNGNAVELRFTAPTRATDKSSLPPGPMRGTLCRQVGQGPCLAVRSGAPPLPTAHTAVMWTDTLPPELAAGPARPLHYQVEFFSAADRSAGASNAAEAVAGASPGAVRGLSAHGSRRGVVLSWEPSAGVPGDHDDVLLERKAVLQTGTPVDVRASPAADKPVQLQANSGQGARTLDSSAVPGIRYRYIAVRQRTVQLVGHILSLRSEASTPVEFTLEEIYPPLPPTGLELAGFSSGSIEQDEGAAKSFAVDLIWQPVADPGLAGYNVYRESVPAKPGATAPEKKLLNPRPVTSPAFHDASAQPGTTYRYGVTAVDTHGNESAPATAVLTPLEQQ